MGWFFLVSSSIKTIAIIAGIGLVGVPLLLGGTNVIEEIIPAPTPSIPFGLSNLFSRLFSGASNAPSTFLSFIPPQVQTGGGIDFSSIFQNALSQIGNTISASSGTTQNLFNAARINPRTGMASVVFTGTSSTLAEIAARASLVNRGINMRSAADLRNIFFGGFS